MQANQLSFRWVMLILILVISLAAAGCTGYPGSPGPATTPQTPGPAGNNVTMKHYAFIPETMTISSGSTVTWLNQDSAAHTIVSDASGPAAEGALFRSSPLQNGESYSHTFDTPPGTYPYHCSIHPSMKGTITVR